MADIKPNEAGLYFVNAAGKIVPENSADVVGQYDEEGLRTARLGHYSTLSDDQARLKAIEVKAEADARTERERQARLAQTATPTAREAELEARVAQLEAEAAKSTAASANKAVGASANK